MSNYLFYNVQVLPFGKSAKEIGPEGYKKIFKSIDSRRANTIVRKSLHIDAFHLPGRMFLSFFNMHFGEEGRVYGDFIKFDQPKALYDTYSGKAVQQIPAGSSSQRAVYRFQFDLENHILAVESPSGSLRIGNLIRALNHFIGPVVNSLYPQHVLDVNVITSSDKVEDVFLHAEYYKTVAVEVSFSNSSVFNRALLEVEQELKDNGISKKEVVERSSKDGKMSSPTQNTKYLLELAKILGDARIRYFDSRVNKLKNFVYSRNPFKIAMRPSVKESDEEFRDRIAANTDKARAQGGAQ